MSFSKRLSLCPALSTWHRKRQDKLMESKSGRRKRRTGLNCWLQMCDFMPLCEASTHDLVVIRGRQKMPARTEE